MVVISVKYAGGDGFLFETTTDTPNNDLISSLVDIHNERLRSGIIVDSVRGLMTHGPMIKPDNVGIDKDDIQHNQEVIDESCKNANYNPDSTGMRTGNAPDPAIVKTLDRVNTDLMEYVDKAQVQRRVALTKKTVLDKIANVRGAVMMAYPMGLPEWDNTKLSLDSIDGLRKTKAANDVLDFESTSLWIAGKEFEKGKLVSDRLGKNEKTKVIAKLQKTSNGPPAREPMVSEEERKAMMAHYFKRQEEMKRISLADDEDYLNSEWADPKEMKKSLQGLSHIRAPGL